MLRRPLACALLSILAACGDDDDRPDPPEPTDFEVDVGGAMNQAAGTDGFRAVEEGAALTLQPGSQGGFHVFLNLRLPADATAELTAQPVVYRSARRVSDGTLVSRNRHRINLEPSDPGRVDTDRSIALFLCPTPIGVAVADEPLEVTVELAPDYDAAPVARGTLQFVPVCPDDDQADFCQRICFG